MRSRDEVDIHAARELSEYIHNSKYLLNKLTTIGFRRALRIQQGRNPDQYCNRALSEFLIIAATRYTEQHAKGEKYYHLFNAATRAVVRKALTEELDRSDWEVELNVVQ